MAVILLAIVLITFSWMKIVFFLLMTNEIFVRGPINNKPAFVQITDMHRTVYKALSESMTV